MNHKPKAKILMAKFEGRGTWAEVCSSLIRFPYIWFMANYVGKCNKTTARFLTQLSLSKAIEILCQAGTFGLWFINISESVYTENDSHINPVLPRLPMIPISTKRSIPNDAGMMWKLLWTLKRFRLIKLL